MDSVLFGAELFTELSAEELAEACQAFGRGEGACPAGAFLCPVHEEAVPGLCRRTLAEDWLAAALPEDGDEEPEAFARGDAVDVMLDDGSLMHGFAVLDRREDAGGVWCRIADAAGRFQAVVPESRLRRPAGGAPRAD